MGPAIDSHPGPHITSSTAHPSRSAQWPFKGRLPTGNVVIASRPLPTWIDACAPAGVLAISRDNFTSCMASHGGRLSAGAMPKACESTYTDQSVINTFFGKHGTLEGGFNQVARFGLGPPYTTNDSVLHFVGWPKPWANASRKHPARHHSAQVAMWRDRCRGLLPESLAR